MGKRGISIIKGIEVEHKEDLQALYEDIEGLINAYKQ